MPARFHRRLGVWGMVLAAILGAPGLTATARGQPEGAGDVRWRVRIDDVPESPQFLAVAPDGTIYAAGRNRFYAVDPDGAVRWTTTAAFGMRAISIGADGTIYTGAGTVSGGDVVALDPADGAVRWRFVPPNPHRLAAGPNVGPDGNIYAVQGDFAKVGTLGAFSLTPEGDLRWSNRGNPALTGDTIITLSEVEFGADRLHFGFYRTRSGSPVLYTFDLEGNQLWTTSDLRPPARTFPVMDPMNRVISSWGQTGVRAFSPSGTQEWFAVHPSGAQLIIRPTVDGAGIIYAADWLGVILWAINPDGSTRWVAPDKYPNGVNQIGVSPDDRVLVAQAYDGEQYPVRGYDTADGSRLWTVQFAPEQGRLARPSTYEPVFSPDGCTAYVTVRYGGVDPDFGYLVAISLRSCCAADINRDGSLESRDLFDYLVMFLEGREGGDFNGDGAMNSQDVFDFLAAFFVGCE